MSAPSGVLTATTPVPGGGSRRSAPGDESNGDGAFSAALSEAVESTASATDSPVPAASSAEVPIEPAFLFAEPPPLAYVGAEFVSPTDSSAAPLDGTTPRGTKTPADIAAIDPSTLVPIAEAARDERPGREPGSREVSVSRPLLIDSADTDIRVGSASLTDFASDTAKPIPEPPLSAPKQPGGGLAPEQSRVTESDIPAPAAPSAAARSEAAVLDPVVGQPAPGAVRPEHASPVPPTSPMAPPPATIAAAHPAPISGAPSSVALSAQILPPMMAVASAGPGEHVVTITVSPDNLGPVTVRAHITADGARFELSAPTEAGRESLRALLPELRRDASGTGIDARLDLAGGDRDHDGRDADHGERPDAAPPSATVEARRHQPAVVAPTGSVSTSTTIDITI